MPMLIALQETLMLLGNFSPDILSVFVKLTFPSNSTTFMVDDWVAHTPKSVLAKNFGVNESVFANVPTSDPYILNGTISTASPADVGLTGNSSYVFHNSQQKAAVEVPGGGGNISIVDSRNFPIATTIAAAIVHVEPKGLRELHWHPNVSWSQFCIRTLLMYLGCGMVVLP